jgi:prepilin-type N-terminal cleavage/methylation domain-containing protein/prepilin-type processing-associated H-X9-DG protein
MAQKLSHRGFTLLELLVVIAIIGVLIGLILPAVQKVRESAYRAQCMNSVKQLGLALHQYHDLDQSFPPGVSYRNGKDPYPHLSWLARLLPYIEQDELWHLTQKAYQQDKWPGHNPPHVGLDTVIPLFACPSDSRTLTAADAPPYHVAFTSYLGVLGQNLDTKDGILFLDSRIRLADVRDGTSQTIIAGERPPSADLQYGWWYAGVGQGGFSGSGDMVLGVREINKTGGGFAGPYHYKAGRLDNQSDMFHFWSLHPGGAHFLFADGSVHFLSYDADSIMPALATRAGGEPVALPD